MQAETPTSIEQKVVLVVDDDQALVHYVTATLESAGHRVLTASEAKQGIHLTLTNRPNLVLMDLVLPGSGKFGGFYALCEIRKSQIGRTYTPVVATSSSASLLRQMKDMRVGFDDYWMKPMDPEVMLKQVERILATDTLTLRHLQRHQLRSLRLAGMYAVWGGQSCPTY